MPMLVDLSGMTDEDRSYFMELKQSLDPEKDSLKGGIVHGKLSTRKLKRKRLSSPSH
jgi:hypothetical protein